MNSLENANATKKAQLILNKLLLFIPFLVFSFVGLSQKKDPVGEKWQELHSKNGFKPSKDFEGPENNSYTDPSNINENDAKESNGTNNPYQGLPYSDREIKRGRNGKNSSNGSGGNGTLENNPDIRPGESISTPDVEIPDPDLPKSLGIIALIVALAYITYLIIKNRSAKDQALPFKPLEEDLNPATIPKTELEMRLEEALKAGNYRECVRIYFLFTMKSLIEQKQIFWKKEKTNLHYIIDLSGTPNQSNFISIVDIYDVVWYGDYPLEQSTYFKLEPKLKSNYQSIESAR